ncbi:hypothetical protein TYRP_020960 [Tyrophagus putrescentiae]|nr:hypothetical protein TYRP_020960 [Tyrophagus putrescentiae]
MSKSELEQKKKRIPQNRMLNIIVFGKPCMPTLIKTGGKKGKQLIVLPAENGQNCGKQEGGGLQGPGYGSSGSSYYGNTYFENAGYGGGGYSYQNSLLYSSPMMMTGMPSIDDLYSHQMMANMGMKKMMSSAYRNSEMTMMPVYSKSGSGMSGGNTGEGRYDHLKMNSYGNSGNSNENSRPMHTDSSYKTGRPMIKSENEMNRGQYRINRDHDDEEYSGKYGRELQSDDHDDQLQLQNKRQQMHVNSVENMLPEKSEMQKSSRSWRKKADDEMMHAMASMLSFTLKFNAFTIVAVDFVYHK